MPYEYRVRWQREGLKATTGIYQTEKAAREKVARMIELDQTKHDEDHDCGQTHAVFGEMPDLIGKPKLERREVTAWEEIPTDA